MNLSLVFTAIFLIVALVINEKIAALTAISRAQNRYNNALDNAVSDALLEVVDCDMGERTTIDYAEITHSFFRYLSWNLGASPESLTESMLLQYTPVIAYVVDDGVYLMNQKIEESSINDSIGGTSVVNIPPVISSTMLEDQPLLWENQSVWNTSMEISKKYLFYKERKGFAIQYTLSDYIRIQNLSTMEVEEGVYNDLVGMYPEILPESREAFDQERRLVIIQCITEEFSRSIEQHNRIAKKYGIQYQFQLPVIPNEEWYRTVNDISMIVLFQGYPYGNSTLGYYNKVALGGARLYKEKGK